MELECGSLLVEVIEQGGSNSECVKEVYKESKIMYLAGEG